ncbi:uncharacterized protein B0I36DRAFT_365768 [Microdochium trichocladiopsis]|uniref:Clock-controlled protein 6 n=1 Tax=Microdochium trichocladiopsis TaxID=1682393 RepID=A0A9P8Y0A8_9PEZI|nr:uncharacterized protein B0I36DRAFT_365768 [Microdochium trichocladiopsis]KAH7026165.1 hypothetical protein B0I36DRAFT_365768 [Microdochium trichocladiopsis]
MQFAVAVLALAAGVSANYPVPANTTSYTTSVITSTEIYCPGSTTLTYGTQTYEVTEPTTLTITDCPVTVVTPVYSTSSVICHSCTSAPPAPVYPTIAPNSTYATTTYHPVGTGSIPPVAYPTIPTAGSGKVVVGLAGVLAAVAAAL